MRLVSLVSLVPLVPDAQITCLCPFHLSWYQTTQLPAKMTHQCGNVTGAGPRERLFNGTVAWMKDMTASADAMHANWSCHAGLLVRLPPLLFSGAEFSSWRSNVVA